jgi:DNA-binding HxlR family transcriptional regulator
MGRPPEYPTTDDVLAAMNEQEPYWAGELAEELEASRRTLTRRLNDLVDEGRINKKMRGNRKAIFWCVDE